MDYKLQIMHDEVSFLMRTGKDLVLSKMTAASALSICEKGKITKDSPNPHYPIAVDDTYFFEGEFIETPVKSLRRKGKK